MLKVFLMLAFIHTTVKASDEAPSCLSLFSRLISQTRGKFLESSDKVLIEKIAIDEKLNSTERSKLIFKVVLDTRLKKLTAAEKNNFLKSFPNL